MPDFEAFANGKIILFGEHAVVYGVEAIAAGIPNAVKASVSLSLPGQRLRVPAWGIDLDLSTREHANSLLYQSLALILDTLECDVPNFELVIDSHLPPGGGLGASAAFAVVAIRCFAGACSLDLSDAEVNDLALECEKLAHGNPSGLDNTLATYGGLCAFQRNSEGPQLQTLSLAQPVKLVVAMSGKKGYTAETVARVRGLYQRDEQHISAIFDEIGGISMTGRKALADGDKRKLASLFDKNQECLRQLGVSCPEIEQVLSIARDSGALGGKLTGSGDGGAIIILPGDDDAALKQALQAARIEFFDMQLLASYT